MMTALSRLPTLARAFGAIRSALVTVVSIIGLSSLSPAALAEPAKPAPAPSTSKLISTIAVGTRIELRSAKPTQWQKVFNHFCQRAADGSISATSKLAWLTVHGAGTEADTLIASSLFKRAAAHGDLSAQHFSTVFQSSTDRLPKCLTHPAPRELRAKLSNKKRSAKKGVIAPHKIARAVNRLARRYKIDPRLVMAIAQIESGFRTQVVSPMNATGIMQLTPDTAERFGVKNSRNWVENLAGGMAYLRWLLAYFEGDVILVAAAYNSGEGNVNKHAGVPPFQETMDYVAKVRAIYHRDWHPYNAKVMSPSPALAQIRREIKRADETVATR